MTMRELCAAIVVSDNAAANILLTGIGGPPALTAFMRNVDDKISRLDRCEPELNSNMPGDPRDTTTPRAMVDSMLRIFTQDVLSHAVARVAHRLDGRIAHRPRARACGLAEDPGWPATRPEPARTARSTTRRSPIRRSGGRSSSPFT